MTGNTGQVKAELVDIDGDLPSGLNHVREVFYLECVECGSIVTS